MREKLSGFEVQESQRQSWLSIAAVWAGGMICVPCLMIGGVLTSGGLSLSEIIISILIGYGLICLYMIFIGMQACDTGLPVSVMAAGALGEKGARPGFFAVQKPRRGDRIWNKFRIVANFSPRNPWGSCCAGWRSRR